MSATGNLHRLKVFGSTVVSPRGQAVIPANARKELGIESGDTLLVCGTPHGQGLLFLKVDAVEKMLGVISKQLTDFGKIVKEVRTKKATSRKGR